MEAFIIYIAKIGICLGIFLLIYAIFLRRTTFFRFNRVFLIIGLIASLAIPAIKYTYDVVIFIPAITYSENIITNEELTSADNQSNVWHILFIIYVIGIILLATKNIYSYIKLTRLIKDGISSENENFKVIESIKIQSPFTVLNYILLNSSKLSQTERDLILKHETTHINQKHWIDLLFSESILLLQWFNPIAWIYISFLKENHEYLADKAVIDSGISPALYQAVLVNQRFQGPVFPISNSFNYTKPSNRLSMIKKTKSSPWKRTAVLTIIPVFGLYLWASSEPMYVYESFSVTNSPEDSIIVVGYENGYENMDKKITIVSEEINNGTTFHFKIGDSIPSNTNVAIKSIARVPKEANPIYIIDDKKASAIEFSKLGSADIHSFSVLKDANAVSTYGHKAKDGVIIIKTMKYVKSSPTINDLPTNALYIINGEKAANINNLKPDDIDNISVLKNKSATDIYGEEGENGVVIINTKKEKEIGISITTIGKGKATQNSVMRTITGSSIILKADQTSDFPLFLKDGKEIEPKEMENIDTDKIESVSILKDNAATEKYGEKAKYGAVEITMKK